MANIGKPLADRVLLKLTDVSEKKSTGGIIMNQSTQTVKTAVVVEVSDGFVGGVGETIPLAVIVGDEVLINNGSGQVVRLEGVDYQLVRESEILMIL